MTQQIDKTRQIGQTAATLLVAYLFVLQGIALGLAIGSRAGLGAQGTAVCLTARTAVDNRTDGPRPASHSFDACCLQHCSGMDGGVIGAAAGADAPPTLYGSLLTPPLEAGVLPRRENLPLGARAPPSLFA